jgi:hypothetical protein
MSSIKLNGQVERKKINCDSINNNYDIYCQ